MKKSIYLIAGVFLLLLQACGGNSDNVEQKATTEPLPILGNKEVIDGKTIHHSIPDFQFIDQDSSIITNATFKDKVYIVDFFFTSCPTICPKVKQQMLRIYEQYKTEDRLQLISHSIDTRNDSIPRLKNYAAKLEVNSDKWHFVTGEKDHLYSMANEYFIIAKEDPEAPGGYDHSGTIILVDENRHVRAFANGTEEAAVSQFMLDIEKLLNEKKTL